MEINNERQYTKTNSIYSINHLCDLIIENSKDIVIAIDQDFNIILVNKASEEWLKCKRQDLMGKLFFDFLPETKEKKHVQLLKKALNENQYPQKIIVETPDQHYEWQVFPLKDNFDRTIGVLNVIKDVLPGINNQDKIESLKKELSEKKLLLNNRAVMAETIIDASDDVILVLDKDLNCCAANKSFLKAPGKNREELLGRNISSCFPYMTESEILRKTHLALNGEQSTIKKTPCAFSEGVFDIIITPLSFHNIVYGILIIASDITELTTQAQELERVNSELAEQQKDVHEKSSLVESIFNSIKDIVAVCDCNLNLVDINKSYLHYLGLDKENVVGRNLSELHPGIKDNEIYANIQMALNGVPQIASGYKYIKTDEYGNLSIIPLKNSNNQVTKILFIGQR
jgi:PAS domain S-box-containing protein